MSPANTIYYFWSDSRSTIQPSCEPILYTSRTKDAKCYFLHQARRMEGCWRFLKRQVGIQKKRGVCGVKEEEEKKPHTHGKRKSESYVHAILFFLRIRHRLPIPNIAIVAGSGTGGGGLLITERLEPSGSAITCAPILSEPSSSSASRSA